MRLAGALRLATGIEAGWGIKAGSGIEAGWGIKAGLFITCNLHLSAGLRIFAGLCLWRRPEEYELRITCSNLYSGEVCYGELVETGEEKLIATRELPAEEWDESRIDVIAQNGNEGLHYGNEKQPDDKPKESGLMQEVSYEQAQLDRECRDFIAELDGYLNFNKETSVCHKSCLHNKAKHLLERINPKPVCKCCGQLLENKDD